MQKKKYIKPEMEEITLQREGTLLSASCDSEFCDEFGSVISIDIDKQV